MLKTFILAVACVGAATTTILGLSDTAAAAPSGFSNFGNAQTP